MMRPSRAALVVLLGATSLGTMACLESPTGPSVRGEGRRVLFIGNSYLYFADIPGLVQALSESSGVAGDKLAVATVAGPNMALIDHWKVGDARREIGRGGWEWVVLQQGPSSTAVNRDSLRLVTEMFASVIREVNATPALFSAWPAQDREQDFPRAIESYSLAATDVQGTFLPVASAWLSAWAKDPQAPLYADGLHPSTEGAYLAALVVYSCLLHRSPVGVPTTLDVIGGGRFSLPQSRGQLLQQAAADTVALRCPTPVPEVRNR